MKNALLKEINQHIEEIWGNEEKRFDILLKLNGMVAQGELKLMDIEFGMKNCKNYSADYYQTILVFKANDKEIKVDYLLLATFDDEDMYDDEMEYGFLEPHELYSITYNEFNDGDVYCPHEKEEGYFLNHNLVKVLKELGFLHALNHKFDNRIFELRNNYGRYADKEFYNKNKKFLKGIKSIRDTMENKPTIVLDSGMPLTVDMSDVTGWIESEKLKEELKKVTNYNLKIVKETTSNVEDIEGIYTITKNDKVVFNFFMDENQEKSVNPLEYYGKYEMMSFLSGIEKENF